MDINPLMNYAAAVVHHSLHACLLQEISNLTVVRAQWFSCVACKEEGHEEQLCATVASCIMCTSEVLLKNCVYLYNFAYVVPKLTLGAVVRLLPQIGYWLLVQQTYYCKQERPSSHIQPQKWRAS
jgi:hypothetical protein